MAHRLTVKQCKQARGLLKWNLRDLSVRSNIKLERLTEFEQNVVKLFKNENAAVVDVLVKAGIVFGDSGEVTLERASRAGALESEDEEQVAPIVEEVIVQVHHDYYGMTPEQYAYWTAMYAQAYIPMMPQQFIYTPMEHGEDNGIK